MQPCADAVLVPLDMSAPTIAIVASAANPKLTTSRMCSLPLLRDDARVSRFRSSPEFAVRSVANFGIEGHQQLYDSSAALNPKFAIGLAAIVVRTSGSRHASARGRRRKTQLRRHIDEVGERGRFHLPHHAPAMRFHRDLADAELEADLLVEPAGNDQCHDLLLAP